LNGAFAVRLVLVDNFVMPGDLDPTLFDVHPHLGLTSLAAAVAPDHAVAIYDPKRAIRFGRHPYDEMFYHRAAADILRLEPEAIGFTTLGCSFIFAVNVAALLKQRAPDLPILLGGPHATMLHRQILQTYDQFDIVVRHEAEETLPPLLAKLEMRAFDRIPGLTWRDGRAGLKETAGLPKIDDLDRLPIPLYDLYPVRELDLDLMRVEAGRGCPFVCTFCSTSSFFQRDYRLKSPDRIVREMDLLHARYGAVEFKLDHDLFTVNRRKVQAFCEAVADRGYRWRVSARTDCVDVALLEQMALAGCIGLYFGIETGSKRMQRIADKRLKLDGVDSILDASENFGIETTASFITGYPEECEHDQDETLDMLGRCFGRPQNACTPQLHILLPEPGTPMFAQRRDTLAYDGYVTKFNARLFGAADRTQVRAHPELYSTYYYYPATMPRARYLFAVDAVDALRAFGHEILSYALRFFEGRLSLLVAQFGAWAAQRRTKAAITPRLALAFIARRFGANHHLTSLFRYGLALNECKLTAAPAPPVGSDAQCDPRDRYRTNPRSRILDDLHDCAMLLARIRTLPREAGPLETGDVDGRDCYLTILHDDRSIHYRIDPDMESILSLFDEPQRLGDVTQVLREIGGETVAVDALLGRLVAIGALVRHADVESRVSGAA
jgi:radical SAM superfamily enzyme YgiQ (UPF0313 family)